MALDDMRKCLHFLSVDSELSIFTMSGFMSEMGHSLTSSASVATTPSTSMSLIASLHDVMRAAVFCAVSAKAGEKERKVR